MFKTISWGQYAGGVLLLLVLYYAYVGAMYYRAELLALLKGKGKAGGLAEAPAPTLATIARKGPLLTKSAITLPAPPPEVAGPASAPVVPEAKAEPAAEEPSQSEGLVQASTPPAAAPELAEPEAPSFSELPTLALAGVEVSKGNKYENAMESNFANDYASTLANPSVTDLLSVTESGVSYSSEEFEPGLTVGIAQLGDFLKRATEGQITQAELVEQVPALDNTDLLLSFYQASSQSAQRLTSQRLAAVAEPGLG
jgi:hypothetical protein